MSRKSRPESYTAIQAAVGERIRRARSLIYLNRAEAARSLGLDPTTLAKIEDGSRSASIFNIIDMSAHFHVTTDFLLWGEVHRPFDPEMLYKLGASDPKLAPQPTRKVSGKLDTAPVSGRLRRPRKLAPVDSDV